MTGRIFCNTLEEIFLENITGEGPSKSIVLDRNGFEKEIGVVEGDDLSEINSVGEGV